MMNKKEYMKPTMRVVKLQHKFQLLDGSPTTSSVTSVKGNVFDIDSFESDEVYTSGGGKAR